MLQKLGHSWNWLNIWKIGNKSLKTMKLAKKFKKCQEMPKNCQKNKDRRKVSG